LKQLAREKWAREGGAGRVDNRIQRKAHSTLSEGKMTIFPLKRRGSRKREEKLTFYEKTGRVRGSFEPRDRWALIRTDLVWSQAFPH